MKTIFYFTYFLTLSLCFCSCARDDKERDLIFSSCANVVIFKDVALAPNSPKVECKRLPLTEVAKKLNLAPEITDELSKSNRKYVELNTSGFHPYDRYTFYSLNVNFSKENVGEFIANNEGVLVPIKPETPLIYCTQNFMKGEPSYYVFISEDKSTCVAAFIVPDPIEYKWKDGAVGSITMLTGDALRFAFVINGFQPNENFTYTSKTCGEKTVKRMTAGPDGKWFSMLTSPVIDQKGGAAIITIDRKNSSEQGILTYYWGEKGIYMMTHR